MLLFLKKLIFIGNKNHIKFLYYYQKLCYCSSSPKSLNYEQFENNGNCSTNFKDAFNVSHIKTTGLQRAALSVGAAAISLINPRRADTIALLGETAGNTAIKYIHQKMLLHKEGQEILRYCLLKSVKH